MTLLSNNMCHPEPFSKRKTGRSVGPALGDGFIVEIVIQGVEDLG
jgi:hypothetical protein